MLNKPKKILELFQTFSVINFKIRYGQWRRTSALHYRVDVYSTACATFKKCNDSMHGMSLYGREKEGMKDTKENRARTVKQGGGNRKR